MVTSPYASPYGMLPMMENSFAKEAASPSVAELSWLIVGLACTGSDSAPAECNGHACETTELHMLCQGGSLPYHAGYNNLAC